MHPQSAELPFTWPGNDSDDERNTGTSIYRLIPSMQKFRSNLTALSQVYNLYLSAYQGRIFVYRPRAAPSQALPKQPDLQLKPKASTVARAVGGQLDESRPHTVNHMITGFLGDEEIILACYDDGDVVAYYTKEIAKRVFESRGTTDTSHRSAPKQFFHENVGISAWGLAVHQKTRLIAVSSNRHEVIVFALALTQEPQSRRASLSRTTQLDIQTRTRNWRIVIRMAPNADNIPSICFIDDCQGNAQRVCAVDIKGTAWLADIWQGNSGLVVVPPLCSNLLRSEEFFPAPSRGWGIFALDERDFLKVKTAEELFGVAKNRLEVVPASNGCQQPLVNVRNAMTNIPDNPHHRLRPPNQPGPIIPLAWEPDMPQLGFAMEEVIDLLGSDASDVGDEEFEDTEDETDDEHDEEGDPENGSEVDSEEDATVTDTDLSTNYVHTHELAQGLGSYKSPGSPPDNLYAWDATLKQQDSEEHGEDKKDTDEAVYGEVATPHKLDMTYFPHSNTVYPTPRSADLMMAHWARPREYNRYPQLPEAHLADPRRKLFLLRTYEKDIELRSFSPPNRSLPIEFGVICSDVLKFGRFRDPGLRRHFHATGRLNMIALAPELSLMAIGSPTGRVVLLTLTRKAVPAERDEGMWEHGFRVEWVLPTGSDEMEHRKTLRPMHGMAMGPVQVGDDIGGKVRDGGPAMPRRYRLMLHYRNHDILSYELTREEQSGKLCIF
ncbi:crt10 protein [Fusarium austroafricanum]|uniref:Crt10 protein n=1 Tax=Fusarium austroafricanum TaxID=2364996 RepID=A0A8H4PC91_9HYPO|nr:crt10 protein [Fusarium austroafricanum]